MAGSDPKNAEQRRWPIVMLLAALFVCALVVAVVLFVFFGMGAERNESSRASASAAEPKAAVPQAPEKPLPPAVAAPDELPEAVQSYLAATAYPPGGGALDGSHDDLLEPNARYEQMKPVPESFGADPPVSFLWTADRYRYRGDEIVIARFEAEEGGDPGRIRSLRAFAQPEGRSGAEGAAVELRFRVRGHARVAELDLSRAMPEHFGPVALLARYAVGGQPQQEETIRIFVTPVDREPAKFTGNFRDVLEDGSLVIEVGIDVAEPGFYRIDANLIGPGDEPVAWSSFKGALAQRDGVVPLRFFGKMLRDRGVAGPYTLQQLRGYLFREGEYPDRQHMRDYDAGRGTRRSETRLFETRDWKLSSFSEAEWQSAHRKHMVELMLQDHARGISLDVPKAATRTPEPPGPGVGQPGTSPTPAASGPAAAPGLPRASGPPAP